MHDVFLCRLLETVALPPIWPTVSRTGCRMQLTDPTPTTDRASSSRIANNIGATFLRRAWQWLTLVDSADPVRYVLNRGFASVISVLIPMVILLVPVFMTINPPTGLVLLFTIPLQITMWWLNRRGTAYGAVLFMLWCVVGIAIGP